MKNIIFVSVCAYSVFANAGNCSFDQFSASPAAKKAITETVEWSLSGAMGEMCDNRGYDVDEGVAHSNLQTNCVQTGSGTTELSVIITSQIPDADTGEVFEVSMKYSWSGNTSELSKSGSSLVFNAEDSRENPDLASLKLGLVHSLANTDTLLLSKEYSYQSTITVSVP